MGQAFGSPIMAYHQNGVNSVLRSYVTDSIFVACTAHGRAEGKEADMSSRFRCPGCSSLFQLNQLPGNGLVRCPSCRATVRVGTTAAPPVATAVDFHAAAAPVRPFPVHHQLRYDPPPRDAEGSSGSDLDRDRRRTSGGSSKGLLIGLAVAGGSIAVLGLLLIIGVAVAFGVATRTQTISRAGYSVDAPGRIVAQSPGHAGVGTSVVNPVTDSEFAILSLSNRQRGVIITPELYLTGVARKGQLRGQQPVERAGLSGIRYETGETASGPAHVGEVYSTGNQLLVLLYFTGADRAQFRGKSPRMDAQSAQRLDDPEAFFASFRKQS